MRHCSTYWSADGKAARPARLLCIALLTHAGPWARTAEASFEQPDPQEVAVRTAPGSNGTAEEARGIIDAPPEVVRRWFTEYEYWPGRFQDVRATRVLARTVEGARVYVRSRIMHELVLEFTESQDSVTYRARDERLTAVGSVRFAPTPDGRTEVTMATSATLRGVLGAVTPKSLLHSREREKLVSDIGDLHRLARGRASTARAQGGQ